MAMAAVAVAAVATVVAAPSTTAPVAEHCAVAPLARQTPAPAIPARVSNAPATGPGTNADVPTPPGAPEGMCLNASPANAGERIASVRMQPCAVTTRRNANAPVAAGTAIAPPRTPAEATRQNANALAAATPAPVPRRMPARKTGASAIRLHAPAAVARIAPVSQKKPATTRNPRLHANRRVWISASRVVPAVGLGEGPLSSQTATTTNTGRGTRGIMTMKPCSQLTR